MTRPRYGPRIPWPDNYAVARRGANGRYYWVSELDTESFEADQQAQSDGHYATQVEPADRFYAEATREDLEALARAIKEGR